MKVIFIAGGYPTETYKGNGIFEFDQALALKEIGIEVIYLSVDLRSIRRKRKFGFHNFYKQGIEIFSIDLPCGRIPTHVLYRIGSLCISYLFKRVSKLYNNINVVHSHFFDIGAMACYSNIYRDIPWIHTEHSSSVNKVITNKEKLEFGKKIYTKASKVISVSPALAMNLKNNFNIESIVIPNLVDLKSFSIEKRQNKENEFILVSTGGLIPLKRMDYLIRGYSEFYKKFPESKLLIIGEGTLKNDLYSLIDELHMKDHIKLLGHKNRQEIGEIYNHCNCFVLLSETETFGVAYIEAMASGLPVIATKCGGPESFVNKKNGILIDITSDISPLIKAMTNIKKYQLSYDAFNISNAISKEFSREKVAEDLYNVYKSIQREEENYEFKKD